MQKICHTCGNDLPTEGGESPFCPHCGTPQLYLSLDNQSVETGGDPKVDESGTPSTGIVPPPRPQQIDWKMAIRCAGAVALIAGALSVLAVRVPVLTPASVMWILSGSLIALGLYQRQRPLAWMDVGIGARIGVVVGLCLTIGLAVPMAAAGVIARFGMHSMGTFDAEMATFFEMVIKQSQMTTPIPPELVQWMHSQEFRAGYVLFWFALGAGFLLLLSMAGGAFAGLLRTRRKAAA